MARESRWAFVSIVLVLWCGLGMAQEHAYRSHPPLRTAALRKLRPLADGPARFVDATRGDDAQAGSESAPWRSLGHALQHLPPGGTLYLREGTYFEQVRIALRGTAERPYTIRAYPGEAVIVDGGLAEFQDSPRQEWLPAEDGAKDEFVSTRRFGNLRDVLGSFADSGLGLQTYYHAQDFRADNERVIWEDPERTQQCDILPLYCGPGLWYDSAAGRIRIRLSHTRLDPPVDNYRGPVDPRTLPLVVTEFDSVPLRLAGAGHVRLQDLTIRGGGYCAVEMDVCDHIEFDGVVVWCGTYGLRVSGTTHLRFVHSALYGNVAPWTFRGDGSKRDYPGRPHRNISRLNTHALLEIDGGRESSVYATPQNDHWELAYSDFTDAHDAVYLGAIHVDFHHNLVENLQDDGIYLSPMYMRHRLDQNVPQIRIHDNLFRGMLTALAFGGSEPTTDDQVYVYRNVFDLRFPVNTGRPSAQQAAPQFHAGKLIGDHGSPPWPALLFYHNTVVAAEPARDAAMGMFGGTRARYTRRVFNNLFVHAARLPGLIAPDPAQNVAADANIYWSLREPRPAAEQLFGKFRQSAAYAASRELYAAGSTTHSQVADPRFRHFLTLLPHDTGLDLRLADDSPALDAGVALPAEWPDSPGLNDAGPPDVGALPRDAAVMSVGTHSSLIVE